MTTVSAIGVTIYYEVLFDTNPGGGGGGFGGEPGGIVPIDGGLSLLMVTGAALGAKRMRDHLRKKKNNDDPHPVK